jgi:hypothetical protein
MFATPLKVLAGAVVAFIFSPAMRADETLRAEAQHAQATPATSEPNVARFNLTFDLRLTNRSTKPINIPKPETNLADTTRISVLGMQHRQPDGLWFNVFQASWYGIGTEKYDPCISIPPSGAAQIDGVASSIILLKKELGSLGSEPTLRLHLLIFCQQSDGKVLSITVPTEAFSLRLPAQSR